jgi:hypothetical protein
MGKVWCSCIYLFDATVKTADAERFPGKRQVTPKLFFGFQLKSPIISVQPPLSSCRAQINSLSTWSAYPPCVTPFVALPGAAEARVVWYQGSDAKGHQRWSPAVHWRLHTRVRTLRKRLESLCQVELGYERQRRATSQTEAVHCCCKDLPARCQCSFFFF